MRAVILSLLSVSVIGLLATPASADPERLVSPAPADLPLPQCETACRTARRTCLADCVAHASSRPEDDEAFRDELRVCGAPCDATAAACVDHCE